MKPTAISVQIPTILPCSERSRKTNHANKMQYNIPELQPDPSTTVDSSVSVLGAKRDLCTAQRMRIRMGVGTIALAMPSSQLQVASSHRHSMCPPIKASQGQI